MNRTYLVLNIDVEEPLSHHRLALLVAVVGFVDVVFLLKNASDVDLIRCFEDANLHTF